MAINAEEQAGKNDERLARTLEDKHRLPPYMPHEQLVKRFPFLSELDLAQFEADGPGHIRGVKSNQDLLLSTGQSIETLKGPTYLSPDEIEAFRLTEEARLRESGENFDQIIIGPTFDTPYDRPVYYAMENFGRLAAYKLFKAHS